MMETVTGTGAVAGTVLLGVIGGSIWWQATSALLVAAATIAVVYIFFLLREPLRIYNEMAEALKQSATSSVVKQNVDMSARIENCRNELRSIIEAIKRIDISDLATTSKRQQAYKLIELQQERFIKAIRASSADGAIADWLPIYLDLPPVQAWKELAIWSETRFNTLSLSKVGSQEVSHPDTFRVEATLRFDTIDAIPRVREHALALVEAVCARAMSGQMLPVPRR